MTPMIWRPYRDLATMAAEMNRLLGQRDSESREECLMGNWIPPVDVFEDEDKLEMTFEVPGIAKEDLDVEVREGTISVRGTRNLEHHESRDNYRRVERSYGTFCRTFSLPERIDTEKISANFRDGLLIVRLPKAEETKPKKVAVKVK